MMPPPNLVVSPQPVVSKSLVYAPLAAGTASGAPTAQISLCLDLTNKEAGPPLQLFVVTFPFTPPANVSWFVFANTSLIPNLPTRWNFGAGNNVILPVPFPKSVQISVYCVSKDPVSVTLQLAPHVNAVTVEDKPQKAYLFPGKASDLNDGEFWQGGSAVHEAGWGGVELFGYDLSVVAYDAALHDWSELVPGGSFMKNEDYRVWDRPVYAMADGVIVRRGPQGPDLPDHAPYAVPKSPSPDTAPGNHFIIQHGSEQVIYGNLKKDSRPSKLQVTSKVIGGKTELGLAGNSGLSPRPGVLVAATDGQDPLPAPRPLLFREIVVVDRLAAAPDGAGPWVPVTGQGLPPTTSLIWPEAVLPHKLPRIPTRIFDARAIDPLALILSETVYVRIHLPDPQPWEHVSAQIAALLRHLGSSERRQLLTRVTAFKAYVEGIERILEGHTKPGADGRSRTPRAKRRRQAKG